MGNNSFQERQYDIADELWDCLCPNYGLHKTALRAHLKRTERNYADWIPDQVRDDKAGGLLSGRAFSNCK